MGLVWRRNIVPFRTDWMWANLHYVEQGGGPYQVHVTVGDPENLVGDGNLGNNLKEIETSPFLKPGTFTPENERTGTARNEDRPEGKPTSKLTIGGKALKK